MEESERIGEIMRQVIGLAKEYYRLTSRPLGATGEVGELLAIELLGLRRAAVRTKGHDAVSADGTIRYEIKSRVVQSGSRRGRLGKIDVNSPFDAVLLVWLSPEYEVQGIWEAPREAVVQALQKPGSIARNERGALGIRQFLGIARQVWPPTCHGP